MTKVLIIESEQSIRDEVIDWLQIDGYAVVGAAEARTGLKFARREVPDIIICNISMPEVDGYDVLIEVRANPQLVSIPFVFLTAQLPQVNQQPRVQLGVDDYITIPFTQADLLETLRTCLERKINEETQTHTQLDMMLVALSEEREKRLLKSRVVAMFTHDFRNHLTAVMTTAGLLRFYGDQLTAERRSSHLSRIEGSTRKLRQMLDEMLVVAEIESGKLQYSPQPVDLGTVVEDIVEEFRLIQGEAYLLVLICPAPIQLQTDPKLIRQIVTNLIANAIKYSPVESTVTVSLLQVDDDIELVVQDQGIGIPAEDLPQLYTPFFRAENARGFQGTGLGLPIVKQAVDLLLGKITVTTEVGQGSEFCVRFPINRPDPWA